MWVIHVCIGRCCGHATGRWRLMKVLSAPCFVIWIYTHLYFRVSVVLMGIELKSQTPKYMILKIIEILTAVTVTRWYFEILHFDTLCIFIAKLGLWSQTAQAHICRGCSRWLWNRSAVGERKGYDPTIFEIFGRWSPIFITLALRVTFWVG